MAKKTVTTVHLTDDLDGTKAEGTVTFGYQGHTYEIELSKKNHVLFEGVLQDYITHARRVGGRKPVAPRKNHSNGNNGALTPQMRAEIRDWARSQGLPVPVRGRIAGSLVEAFRNRK